jgi:hypothetical protein
MAKRTSRPPHVQSPKIGGGQRRRSRHGGDDRILDTIGSETVSLTEAFHHFVALSPTESKAAKDLRAAIKTGDLPHSVGRTVKMLPGLTTPPPSEITIDKPIPAEILRGVGPKFVRESARATWFEPSTKCHFTFENIKVPRNEVLRLRPAPESSPIDVEKNRPGRKEKFDWELFLARFVLNLREDKVPASGAINFEQRARDLRAWGRKHPEIGEENTPSQNAMRTKVAQWKEQLWPKVIS